MRLDNLELPSETCRLVGDVLGNIGNKWAVFIIKATIARWIGHYRTLLEAIAVDMDQAALRLRILSQAEENGLHAALAGPDYPIPDLAFHELIDLQAAATPDAVAVRFEDSTVTYRELIMRADRVAWRLIAAGVARETPVAIYLDRSAELAVAMLAVLKAGGAYVPLDPIYPPARIHAIVSEADVKIALTSATLEDGIKAAIPVCIGIGEAGADSAEEQLPPLPRVRPTDLAYRIFTSGSTGRPKGIDIEHRSVVNLLTAMRQSPGISAADVFLAVTTPCFDIAALELFLPLTAGAELAIASRADVMDPFFLAALIARTSTTMMQATPALWRVLLESEGAQNPVRWRGARPETRPGSRIGRTMEYVRTDRNDDLVAGSTAKRWRYRFRSADREHRLYILDAAGNTAAIGVGGELCIAGAGLARGYHKNQALTQQSFPENPFSSGPNGRFYRTGDRARYLANGRFELLGRADSLPYLEKARGRYRASASVGNVVLLQSHSVVTRFVDPTMAWSDLIKGKLFVHRVPGGHVGMFQDEGASRIAEHLRSLLDQVDAERDQMVRRDSATAPRSNREDIGDEFRSLA